MKRIAFAGLMLIGVLSGCSSSEDAPDSGHVEKQEVQRLEKIIEERDRTITELKEKVGELQAQLEEAVPQQVEGLHTEEEAAGCPSVSYSQDPVDAKKYADYKRIDMPCYSIYIPMDWTYRMAGGELEFVDDRLIVGSTEVLSYFERGALEHWSGNHTEQIGYEEIVDAVPIRDLILNTYQIRLIWTKPAADLDPDWQYDDTRYYVAIKPLERSFGFYFSTKDVPEKVMSSIIQSFRLRL